MARSKGFKTTMGREKRHEGIGGESTRFAFFLWFVSLPDSSNDGEFFWECRLKLVQKSNGSHSTLQST